MGVRLEVVARDPNSQGFQTLPRRWVVERTLAWLSNARRLSKDYEFLVISHNSEKGDGQRQHAGWQGWSRPP